MLDPNLEGAARQQRRERLDNAAHANRATKTRHPKSSARHTLASSLRRFADKLES